jgi:hypothetical protein
VYNLTQNDIIVYNIGLHVKNRVRSNTYQQVQNLGKQLMDAKTIRKNQQRDDDANGADTAAAAAAADAHHHPNPNNSNSNNNNNNKVPTTPTFIYMTTITQHFPDTTTGMYDATNGHSNNIRKDDDDAASSSKYCVRNVTVNPRRQEESTILSSIKV